MPSQNIAIKCYQQQSYLGETMSLKNVLLRLTHFEKKKNIHFSQSELEDFLWLSQMALENATHFMQKKERLLYLSHSAAHDFAKMLAVLDNNTLCHLRLVVQHDIRFYQNQALQNQMRLVLQNFKKYLLVRRSMANVFPVDRLAKELAKV